MVIATRTDTVLSATITQSNLIAAIKTAFLNAGYSNPIDEYTASTNMHLVYAVVTDASKTYGTIYLRVLVTTGLIVRQQLYATWNTGTHTGTGGSTEVTYSTFSATLETLFTALNGGSEYGLVIASQSTNLTPFGIIRPSNKPNWWNLDSWTWGFIFVSSTMNTFRGSGVNPYVSPDYTSNLNNASMGNANPQTNRRDILKGLLLFSNNNQGASAKTSDDIASIAGNGTTRYDTLNIFGTTEQYLVINPVSGGMAVRVA